MYLSKNTFQITKKLNNTFFKNNIFYEKGFDRKNILGFIQKPKNKTKKELQNKKTNQ